MALAVGRRPAGLAHRVLGDGRAAAGGRARHPRRRHRPALPAPRERGGADARRARQAAGPAVDAQRDAAALRREDVEVRGQHPRARRGARRGRPRRAAPVLRGRPLPAADRLHARAARRGGGERAADPRRRPPPAARRLPRGPRAAARRVLRRPRRRLQHRGGAGSRLRLDPRGEPARGPGRRRPAPRDARDLRARQPAGGGRGAAGGAARPRAAAGGGPRGEGLRRGRPAARRSSCGRMGDPGLARKGRNWCLRHDRPAAPRPRRPLAAARRRR